MTSVQTATIAAADHVIFAPAEWIAAEPPNCLQEILGAITDDLEAMLPMIGLGWKIIQLEILKAKTESRLALSQQELL